MAAPPQSPLIFVDTNVYLRLYCSEIRPILGAVCGGYRWVITTELHQEFGRNQSLVSEYAWMLEPNIETERAAAVHYLPRNQRREVAKLSPVLRRQADALLRVECNRRGVAFRTLSRADLNLLLVADLLDATVATDEWPMTHVAKALGYPHCCSLDLLAMLQRDGKLTAVQRRALILDWIRYCERLPHGWQAYYRQLFVSSDTRI